MAKKSVVDGYLRENKLQGNKWQNEINGIALKIGIGLMGRMASYVKQKYEIHSSRESRQMKVVHH